MSLEDPEDILSGSLQTLYSYEPITLASAGADFSYTPPNGIPIHIRTPDTQPSNWALHASSIWTSSRFLTDHIDLLNIPSTPIRVLELGAGAGLPGIVIAQTYTHVQVVVSDYPDPHLIETLSNNVLKNVPHGNARAVAYAWGSDTLPLGGKFDMIIAADTLWNPDLHSLFIRTLSETLSFSPTAVVHLVAGLHTGRYTLEAFLKAVTLAGFTLDKVLEMESNGKEVREWDVNRAGNEDEKERRRWVVWVVLRRTHDA
ncbi:putative methyltransferase-domain-containing protein [Mucidula mucida]|nr:putative methyltransferase-domain-containing protein [Mucidula mucida]